MATTGEFFFDKAYDQHMVDNNKRHWLKMAELIGAAFHERTLSGGTSLPKQVDVLDIGSHEGGLLQLLNTQFPSYVRSLAGIEPLRGPRERAKRLLPQARFVSHFRHVKAESTDLVVSHEMLYFVAPRNLDAWMANLRRVLRPQGGAFLTLGCHQGNTAWRRWRTRLAQAPYHHVTYVHDLMDIVRAAWNQNFEVSAKQLYPFGDDKPVRIEQNADGWGGFGSVQEATEFLKQKYTLILYPR